MTLTLVRPSLTGASSASVASSHSADPSGVLAYQQRIDQFDRAGVDQLLELGDDLAGEIVARELDEYISTGALPSMFALPVRWLRRRSC